MSRLIWTTHAKQRLSDRRISRDQVENTYHSPDSRRRGERAGTMEYRKRFGQQTVTVIVREWNEGSVIVSLWIDPPHRGTADARKRALWVAYRRAGFWGKWWIMFRRIIGV